jgi:hypothetical protein
MVSCSGVRGWPLSLVMSKTFALELCEIRRLSLDPLELGFNLIEHLV